MHLEALQYVERFASETPFKILDIGGRDVNGTPRHLFPNAEVYDVLDIRPGGNVNIVYDATGPPHPSMINKYDLVLNLETFEHCQFWKKMVGFAYRCLVPSGLFVVTCAGPDRRPHSAIDGEYLPEDTTEFYKNINPIDLQYTLESYGFINVETELLGADLRGNAEKP